MYHNDSYSDIQRAKSYQNTPSLEHCSRVPQNSTIRNGSQSVQTLLYTIGLKICNLMLVSPEDLDTLAKLFDIGVNSLIVMEIHSYWKSTVRFAEHCRVSELHINQ